jgi:hypothetical protein
MPHKKYVKLHLGTMNVAARIAGCGFVAVGVALLLTAIFASSERLITAIFAIVGIVAGVALLVVKPLESGDVEGFFDGKSPVRRTGTYERRK